MLSPKSQANQLNTQTNQLSQISGRRGPNAEGINRILRRACSPAAGRSRT